MLLRGAAVDFTVFAVSHRGQHRPYNSWPDQYTIEVLLPSTFSDLQNGRAYNNVGLCHLCQCLSLLAFFTLVGVISSDVCRSSYTTSFTPRCSIFSQSYVFFQGCPCPLLDVIDVLNPGAPLLLFPGIIPRMHVFTRLHLLFLLECPKKAIFLLIIWARSSRLV